MRWMKYRWLYFLISALFILPGIFSLVKNGLRPAIDFTGGSSLELKFNKPVGDLSGAKSEIEKNGYAVESIKISEKLFSLKTKSITKEDVATIKSVLAEKYADMPEEVKFETIGPVLGKELLSKTIIGLILASLLITAYIAWRFKEFKYGICAILAMFHDSIIMLGLFSIFGWAFKVEVDSLFVTALLTVLSFSVHDTVVVYDRIRELQKLSPKVGLETVINSSITETMVRSLNNSLTIVFMLVALLLMGGQTVKWFSAALLIGTIFGTYSSMFTAAPLLVVWSKLEDRRHLL
jgi:preprotein translocase subunit SecF